MRRPEGCTAADETLSARSVDGLRVGVIGYGSVGRQVANALAAEGAAVAVNDVNGGMRTLAEAGGLRWVEGDMLAGDLDVLEPAATGGLLTASTVATLRARSVVGPANNQLADDAVADLLGVPAAPPGSPTCWPAPAASSAPSPARSSVMTRPPRKPSSRASASQPSRCCAPPGQRAPPRSPPPRGRRQRLEVAA